MANLGNIIKSGLSKARIAAHRAGNNISSALANLGSTKRIDLGDGTFIQAREGPTTRELAQTAAKKAVKKTSQKLAKKAVTTTVRVAITGCLGTISAPGCIIILVVLAIIGVIAANWERIEANVAFMEDWGPFTRIEAAWCAVTGEADINLCAGQALCRYMLSELKDGNGALVQVNSLFSSQLSEFRNESGSPLTEAECLEIVLTHFCGEYSRTSGTDYSTCLFDNQGESEAISAQIRAEAQAVLAFLNPISTQCSAGEPTAEEFVSCIEGQATATCAQLISAGTLTLTSQYLCERHIIDALTAYVVTLPENEEEREIINKLNDALSATLDQCLGQSDCFYRASQEQCDIVATNADGSYTPLSDPLAHSPCADRNFFVIDRIIEQIHATCPNDSPNQAECVVQQTPTICRLGISTVSNSLCTQLVDQIYRIYINPTYESDLISSNSESLRAQCASTGATLDTIYPCLQNAAAARCSELIANNTIRYTDANTCTNIILDDLATYIATLPLDQAQVDTVMTLDLSIARALVACSPNDFLCWSPEISGDCDEAIRDETDVTDPFDPDLSCYDRNENIIVALNTLVYGVLGSTCPRGANQASCLVAEIPNICQSSELGSMDNAHCEAILNNIYQKYMDTQ